MDFREWLINEAREKLILYHGTTDALLRPILSQGLIPDPPNRTWEKDDNTSFYTSTRMSLPGVYVTRNLMTAMSSAHNARRHRNQLKTNKDLIVILSVEPKTMVGDEDNYIQALKKIPSPYPNQTGASEHDYTAAYLYAVYLRLKHNEYEGQYANHERENDQKELESWRKNYIEEARKWLLFDMGDQHPQLISRLNSLLEKAFIVALERVVAYTHPSQTLRGDYWEVWNKHQNEWPNKESAERNFLKMAEQFTLTLKRKSQTGEGWNFTARLTDKIGFNGTNKIVAIIRLHDRNAVELIYGKLPSDFYKQYEERVGELTWHDNQKADADR